jgi:hypothetical protein
LKPIAAIRTVLTPILPTIPNAAAPPLLMGLQAAMVECIDVASSKRDCGQELRRSPIASVATSETVPA